MSPIMGLPNVRGSAICGNTQCALPPRSAARRQRRRIATVSITRCTGKGQGTPVSCSALASGKETKKKVLA